MRPGIPLDSPLLRNSLRLGMERLSLFKVRQQPSKAPGWVAGVATPVVVVALAAAVEEHVVEQTAAANNLAGENLCRAIVAAGSGGR